MELCLWVPWVLGLSLAGEARMGWSQRLQEGARVTLLLKSADGPPRERAGREWGEVGRERPRQPHVRCREGKMVTEDSDEGVRESRQGEKPELQPLEVGSR